MVGRDKRVVMNKKEMRAAAKLAAIAAAAKQVVTEQGEPGAGPAPAPASTTASDPGKPPERTAEEAAAWIAERVAKLGDKLRESITAGHVIPSISAVLVGKDASPTKAAVFREYLKLDAQSGEGMRDVMNGKIKPSTPKPDGKDERTPDQKAPGACDMFNYGYDLDVRAKVRNDLLQSLEGPEKAIANMIKGLRAGENDDDTIRTIVLASPKFKGTANLDLILNAALLSK